MSLNSNVKDLVIQEGIKDGNNGMKKKYEFYNSHTFQPLSDTEVDTKNAYIEGYLKGVKERKQFVIGYIMFCLLIIIAFILFVYLLYNTLPEDKLLLKTVLL